MVINNGTPTKKYIIAIHKLNFAYGKNKDILKDVDLSVEKGQWIGICGSSGEGKTTLLRLINGSLCNDGYSYGGSIKIFGHEANEFRKSNKAIATIYQNPDNQIVFTRVVDEIVFGMENLNYSKEKIDRRLNYIVEKLKIGHLCDRNPNHLSSGEKQLIVLAGVLCMDIDILLLDEAIAYVDTKRKINVLNCLNEFKEKGVAIIAVEHVMEHFKMTDKIYTLKNGKLLEGRLHGIH